MRKGFGTGQAPPSGFTLLEILLATSIMAVILLVASSFVGLALASRVKQQTVTEVEQQGLQVLQRMSLAIRNAEVITAPASGTAASGLTLDVLPIASDPTTFDLLGETVRIKEGGGAPVVLTNSRVKATLLTVTNLSRADTPGTVRIELMLEAVNPSGRNEQDYRQTFQTSATLRQP